ncbi:MAG: hypothetical protein OHK0029_17480 [Armatimonadaceae bacterium]
MRFAVATACLVSTLCFSSSARAIDIVDLFNTGVDNAGVPLSAGSTDPHYTMTANNFGSGSTTSFVINPNPAYVTSTNSRWISVDTGDGSSINGGNYTVTYSTSFVLPANADLTSVVIQGQWAVDNTGLDILINGSSTGLTSPGFGSFTNFNLPTGSFVAGTNTLAFQWRNVGGPGGLNVVFTSASYELQSNAAPEPASLALLTLVGTVLVATRRRR